VRAAAAVNEVASKALFDAEVESFPQKLLDLRGWTINSNTYPALDVSFAFNGRAGRVRMICDDWNELPPSIQFLNSGGEFLSTIGRDPAGVINVSPHPATGRPFICSPGSREYHAHPSHLDDRWDNYKNRSDFNLGGILTKVWRAWKKSS
jgi:hypothetical protein